MEQITVTTKLRMEHSFTVIFNLAAISCLVIFILVFHDWQNSKFLLFPLMVSSLWFRTISDLPKQNIRAVVLDHTGITIQRRLFKDLYLPYKKLAYVWNYTFHFRGFELDTNLFVNQREIIDAINRFRTEGLIQAPERKPGFWEIMEQWALSVVVGLCLLAVMIAFGYELFTGAEWLTRATMLCAIIVCAAAFLAQTAYRFLLRSRKTAIKAQQ